jgi:hypothetical protein
MAWDEFSKFFQYQCSVVLADLPLFSYPASAFSFWFLYCSFWCFIKFMSCSSELECPEEVDQLSMEEKLIWISPLICLAYSVPIDICAIFFYFNVASSFKLKSMAIFFLIQSYNCRPLPLYHRHMVGASVQVNFSLVV